MRKHLINLSDRQDKLLIKIAKELGLPLSEIIRRGLDVYIAILIENKYIKCLDKGSETEK